MIKPFEYLEYLSFADMPKLQEWVIFEGEVFPRLWQLRISCCPKLSRGLPNHLPSLTKLEIISCNQLVASLPRAPALHELYCDGKIRLSSGNYYPSLERMTIMGGHDSDWSFHERDSLSSNTSKLFECGNLESLSGHQWDSLRMEWSTFQMRHCCYHSYLS